VAIECIRNNGGDEAKKQGLTSTIKHLAHEAMSFLRGRGNTVELNPVTGGAGSTWTRVQKTSDRTSDPTVRRVRKSCGDHVHASTVNTSDSVRDKVLARSTRPFVAHHYSSILVEAVETLLY